MQGDFSRIRFNRGKNYTAVLEQQGRVALDADANEQQFIDGYESQTRTIDAVGQYGGPAADAGFQITVPGDNEIHIGSGRYYVNGLLCENAGDVTYDAQPYLIISPGQPDAGSLLSQLNADAGNSVIQVWLQVWQRLQTALDDPCLCEPALGQADTTARLQTVWQVVADVVRAPEPQPGSTDPAPSCCQEMYATPARPPSSGTMLASTAGPAAECGCGPVAAAGYQGIENQLYRVEIHNGGSEGEATFKWSRENGSVVTAISKVSGSTVWVSPPPPDTNLGFQVGQWVELTDDTFELGQPPNGPGNLYQILGTSPTDTDPFFTLNVPADQTLPVDPAKNARMRRWDMSGPAVTPTGIPLSPGSPIDLENGIQVTFDPQPPGPGLRPIGTYQSGDYWTIPARTATGQIEWPPCGSDEKLAQHPTSIQVYRAPLACIHYAPPTDANPSGTTVDECRQKFSPLTTIAPPATVEAIHVTGISWVNDDVVTLDALVTDGLTITLDQAPTSPLSAANVVVTVELADPAAVDGINAPQNPGNPRAPKPPTTNLRTVMVIDNPATSHAEANPPTITWQVPQGGSEAQSILIGNLNTYLFQGAPAQQWARVRIRLLGQLIYAAGSAGVAYLDGRALGQAGVRQDGSPRIDLKLPSGAATAASDFEGWLYVAPMLQTIALLVTPEEVAMTVDSLDRVTSVLTTTSPPEPANPTAEIVLNYAPLTDTTVTLTLSNNDGTGTGVGTVVSLPGGGTVQDGQMSATVTIQAGQMPAPIPINVVGNPGAGTTLNFNISATVGPKLGVEYLANAPFSVTGATVPPLPKPTQHPVSG